MTPQSRSFAEMLEQIIRLYHNRAVEAAQVIEELIKMAKEMREASRRGEDLGLTEEELAFYDALETNDSASLPLLRDNGRAQSPSLRKVGPGDRRDPRCINLATALSRARRGGIVRHGQNS